jgi:hypothetical protein
MRSCRRCHRPCKRRQGVCWECSAGTRRRAYLRRRRENWTLCPGCDQRRYPYARGLCRGCHADPALRARVAPLRNTRGGRPDLEDTDAPTAPAPGPLPGVPCVVGLGNGSPARANPTRLAELIRRAACRQELFHPKDRF